MKVLHIITDLRQGGAEAMLEKIVRASAALSPNVEHAVVSLRSLGVVGPRLQAAGVSVTALGLNSAATAAPTLWQLWRLLRAQPRDVIVQTWLYHADLLGGVIARLARRPRIHWNLRGAVTHRSDLRYGTFVVLKLCAWVSRWVPRHIVSCGPVVMSSHVAQGYARQRCVVIGNGFELDQFRPDPTRRQRLRQQLGVAPDTLLIGTVARLDPLKDFPTLARAAAQVAGTIPDARFLWVGAGVDTDEALTALLGELGLSDHIIRLGLRRDVADLLNALDLFCMSSRSEGFPNALGEAMACALPCVSTDAGDAAFLLGDREWIVPVESPAALGSALVRMARLPTEERQQIGDKNRSRVAAEFGVEQVWGQYLDLYGAGAKRA
jgi:glycosyltransferase involved in cell wall biosynthesis